MEQWDFIDWWVAEKSHFEYQGSHTKACRTALFEPLESVSYMVLQTPALQARGQQLNAAVHSHAADVQESKGRVEWGH